MSESYVNLHYGRGDGRHTIEFLTPRDVQVLVLGLESLWQHSTDWAEYGNDVVRLMGLLQPLTGEEGA